MSERRSDPKGGSSPPEVSEDPRAAVGSHRRKQQLRWGLLLAVLLALASIFSGGLFLYAVIVVALVLAFSLLLTTVSLSQLEVARRISASEILCGGVIDAWLVVHNPKSLPAAGLEWSDRIEAGLDVEGPTHGLATLAAGARKRLAYRLHSTRRGLYRIGPAVVEASGPLGLVKRFLVDSNARFVTVLPRTVTIGKGWPLGHRPIHEIPRQRSLFEDPSRFHGLRDYQRGDSLKRIHWRATARCGSLQVKLFEPAVLEGILLAIEMNEAAYDSEVAEELAITGAASLAEMVLGAGQNVALLSNGADAAERYPRDWQGGTFRRLGDALEAAEARRKVTSHRPLEAEAGRGRWQLERLRLLLARLVRASGPGLPELLLSELPRLSRQLVLMIVTPCVDAELASVVESLRRSHIEVAVLWIRPPEAEDGGLEGSRIEEGIEDPALLGNVPLHVVASEGDLEQVGAVRL